MEGSLGPFAMASAQTAEELRAEIEATQRQLEAEKARMEELGPGGGAAEAPEKAGPGEGGFETCAELK